MTAVTKSSLNTILSFLLFQISWWGLFLAAKNVPSEFGLYYLVSMFLITALFLFFQVQYFSDDPHRDFQTAKKSFILGIFLDGSMIAFGLLKPGPALFRLQKNLQMLLLSFTLISLWVIFSMTLNASLKKLRTRRYYFMALCAVFGPVTYLATEKLLFLDYGANHSFAVGIHATLWALWAFQMALPKER